MTDPSIRALTVALAFPLWIAALWLQARRCRRKGTS